MRDFEQENYEKLLRVYENCRWFINIHEQLIQNLDNLQQELDQYKNNWEELKKTVKQIEKDVCDGITDEHLTTLEMTEIFLDKMKELEEDK